jgi:two-component sensor histidine kinase
MTPRESTEATKLSHKKRDGSGILLGALLAFSFLGPLAVFGAVSAYDYRQALREAESQILSVLDLVTGHAESVLKLQALALGAISEKLRGLTDQEILAATTSNQRYLRSLRNYAGETLRIFVFDAEGKGLLDSDREQIDADVDVGDRDFYAWHRLNLGTGMFISGPARSRADGTPVFFVSVRRSGSNGVFQGVVAIGVEQKTFLDYWECFAPEQGVAVSLANANGTFLVRNPPVELVNGSAWSARDQLAQMIGGRKERLVSRGISPIDGVERLVAYRPVEGFPALVTYGLPYQTVTLPWQLRLATNGVITALAILCLTSLMLFARRRALDLHELNQSLESQVQQRTAIATANERRIALLASEIDHRSKNTLAVVQAILQLTPKDDVLRYASVVKGRIKALGHAQALLSEQKWRGVSLPALLTAELRSVLANVGESGSRVKMDGPLLMLPGVCAQPLALVFHELTVHASKCGALSFATGYVNIRWYIACPPHDKRRLQVRWKEAGIPLRVGVPATSGLSMRMLDAIIRVQLGGTVQIGQTSDGTSCDFSIPLPDGGAFIDEQFAKVR